MLLVTAHEFGHFLMARKNDVRVLEFGIGFPPRAKAWTLKNGMIFSINWLPIGGFCQMDGESAIDEREGTFGKASFWSKTKILFGGVAMNWLVAWVILTILAWTGMPQYLDNQFTVESDTRTEGGLVEVISVAENSPAEVAGFLAGDTIMAVDGNGFSYGSQITAYNNERTGEEVTYTVARAVDCGNLDGAEEVVIEACTADDSIKAIQLDLTPTLNEAGSDYLLGVVMGSSQALTYSTWSAPIVGAGLTLQMTGETFKGVGELIWNLITGVGSQFSFNQEVRESGQESLSEVKDSVSGPVGIVGMIFPAFTSMGLPSILYLAALISISLACMNVLPIPALDGGRWLLIGWYKLRHKKLTKETEEKIVSRAMMVLLALIFIITIIDVTRFFQ